MRDWAWLPKSVGCGGSIRPQLCPQSQRPRAVGGRALDPQTYPSVQGHQVWQDSLRGNQNAPLWAFSVPPQAWRSCLSVVGLWWGCWDQAPELIEEEMQVGAAWGGAAIQGKGL